MPNPYRLFFLVLIGLVFSLQGCATQHPLVRPEEIAELLSKVDSLYRSPSSAPITSIEALHQRVLENHGSLKKLDLDIANANIQIEQGNSIVLPRIDAVFGGKTAYTTGHNWDNGPEIGLVAKYDLNAVLFHRENIMAATSSRDILVFEKQLAAQSAILETDLLIAEYLSKKAILERIRRIIALDREVNGIRQKINNIVPEPTIIDTSRISSETLAQEFRAIGIMSELERLSGALSQLAASPLDLDTASSGFEEYLHSRLTMANNIHCDRRTSEIFAQDLTNAPILKVLEKKLLLARLNKEKVAREGLPQLRASVGGGNFAETNNDDNNILLSFNLLYPLFDAGDQQRRVRTQDIALKKTEREILETLRTYSNQQREICRSFQTSGKQMEIVSREAQGLKQRFHALSGEAMGELADTEALLTAERAFHQAVIIFLESKMAFTRSALELASYITQTSKSDEKPSQPPEPLFTP